ncbi:hypothetical protein K491DRAFT_712677 [Lophiostoma macrostomum CBS 122681]|uniref:Uncharacterized protein n=1 Tax=Lophiostoma macrostomum CBS 122681 TaxID=1314788 RepID=A0A6A6TJ00_9PLEO|nr:hypothetical protein K491DRAFT_712677 [Lophiostoma macrostomum CBS 122681]
MSSPSPDPKASGFGGTSQDERDPDTQAPKTTTASARPTAPDNLGITESRKKDSDSDSEQDNSRFGRRTEVPNTPNATDDEGEGEKEDEVPLKRKRTSTSPGSGSEESNVVVTLALYYYAKPFRTFNVHPFVKCTGSQHWAELLFDDADV